MNREEHPGEAGVLPEEMAQEPEENTYQVVDGKAVIPEGTAAIGEYAFAGYSLRGELREALLPDGVVSIGAHAFDGCENLTEIKLPEGLTSIGSSAFSGCRSLRKIELPDSVTEIGSFAFLNCEGLTEIRLPEGLTKLRDQVFSGCRSLRALKIPAAVQAIGKNVFKACASLDEIGVDAGNQKYREADGMILTKAGKNVVVCRKDKETCRIPEGVVKINADAFMDCRRLEEIVFPESVKDIGERAFMNCESLERVKLPRRVEALRGKAFLGCGRLQEAEFFAAAMILEAHIFDSPALRQVRFAGEKVYVSPKAFEGETCQAEPVLAAPKAPISEFPAALKPLAAEGFVKYREEYEPEAAASYVKYIRSQRKKLWMYPDILRFMLEEKYIPAGEISDFVDEAARQQKTELAAMLLEYRKKNFSQEEVDKGFKL